MKGQALLIGIQDYTQAGKLPGVSADVRLLREALVEHGAYQVASINNSAAGDDSIMFSKSEREKLQDAIDAWLAARSADETVFLYFSGHGFRDEQNRLYLAAVDCDPQNPETGGMPIAWLRERLVACPAKMKLLVLDACHAGSAKAASKGISVEARELTDFFGQIEGLITLASCTGQQKSILWPEKGQSLFTYWLAQGLNGHADREPLGQITVNELEDFVAKKVRRSAKVVASVQQTPTRLQGPGVTEDVILQMQPISYKSLIENLAEQMDAVIRLEGVERVGIVPRFVCGMAGQLLGRDYGLWTDNAPAELVAELARKGQGDYRVISINAVRELLQQKGIAPKDIGTSKSKAISIEGRNLPALIGGRIESLPAETIALRCNMIDVTDGAILGLAGGTAALSGAEVGMNGVSGRVEPIAQQEEDSVPPELEPVQIQPGPSHPLADPTFPYRARIMIETVNGRFQERQLKFDGKDCYVPLAKDEVFSIYVTNGSGKPTFARILVDGLNTLPEKSREKGVYVEARKGAYRQAQPVNLIEARAWGPLAPNREYGFPGFFLKTGTDAIVDKFKVVDAQRSFAADAGYTDQLGLITVAFFEMQQKPKSKPLGGGRGSLGIGSGGRYQTQTDEYDGDHIPGRMLAVLHIRYGD